jgi:hypothetical protein
MQMQVVATANVLQYSHSGSREEVQGIAEKRTHTVPTV